MNESNLKPFWSESENGRISLDNYEFKQFLETNQFFKNKPNPESSFNIIREDGIFLKIKDEVDVKDFVLSYVLSNNLGKKVYNLMTGKMGAFKRDFLSMIKSKEIETLKDTKDIAYLFYKNGVVEVTKDGYELKTYKSYGVSIWEDQVIDRDFVKADHHESEYRTFIWKIAGESIDRYNTLQSIIGYLLHSYNNSGNQAIILNDELISDDPNGRSGKGLFCNAISHLKKVQSLNGKSFKFDAPFPYQSVKTDCQVLVWDDVKRNFDFEQLFSVITEGIEITYKGKDTIKLPISESPKIVVSTNYAIKGKGGSHEARRFEVELSSFFNSNHTPIDFFGHRLFDSWNKKQWARFDTYMLECLKKYLTTGLVGYDKISLPYKQLEIELTKDLMDLLKLINVNEWQGFNEFYDNYRSCVSKSWMAKTKHATTTSIKKYCTFFHYDYEEVTNNGIKKFKIIEHPKL